jgi:molecular chaperone GrpE (heat shock protein)
LLCILQVEFTHCTKTHMDKSTRLLSETLKEYNETLTTMLKNDTTPSPEMIAKLYIQIHERVNVCTNNTLSMCKKKMIMYEKRLNKEMDKGECERNYAVIEKTQAALDNMKRIHDDLSTQDNL